MRLVFLLFNNVAPQIGFDNRSLSAVDIFLRAQADFRLRIQCRRIERACQHRAQHFADELGLCRFIPTVRVDGFPQQRPHGKRLSLIKRGADNVQPLLMLLIMLHKCIKGILQEETHG